MANYYDVLGIGKSASGDEIKKAYKKQAIKYHPDKNQGDKTSEEKFKEINEAYDCLKDSQKKAAYDRFGHDAYKKGGMGNAGGNGAGGPGGFGGFDFNSSGGFSDIFDNIFSDFMGGGAGQSAGGRGGKASMRGADLQYAVDITLEEAFNGLKREVKVRKQAKCGSCDGTGSKSKKKPHTCPTCGGAGKVRVQQGFFAVAQTCHDCHGSGVKVEDPCSSCAGTGVVMDSKEIEITIPRGISNGTTLRVSGEGEAGFNGAPAGDMFIIVNVKSHRIYKRNGNDIFMEAPIDFIKAILGGEIEVPNLDGKNLTVKIPKGTQPGDVLKVRGKGFRLLHSDSRGDLMIQLDLKIPKKVSKKQEEMLRKVEKEGIDSGEEGFFSKIFG